MDLHERGALLFFLSALVVLGVPPATGVVTGDDLTKADDGARCTRYNEW